MAVRNRWRAFGSRLNRDLRLLKRIGSPPPLSQQAVDRCLPMGSPGPGFALIQERSTLTRSERNRHRANDTVAVGPQVTAIRVAPGNQQISLRLLRSWLRTLGTSPLPMNTSALMPVSCWSFAICWKRCRRAPLSIFDRRNCRRPPQLPPQQ